MGGVRVTLNRTEALAVLVFGALLIIAGLVWAFGPWGLIGSGVVIAASVLFVDVKEGPGREAVADAAPFARRGVPLHRQ